MAAAAPTTHIRTFVLLPSDTISRLNAQYPNPIRAEADRAKTTLTRTLDSSHLEPSVQKAQVSEALLDFLTQRQMLEQPVRIGLKMTQQQVDPNNPDNNEDLADRNYFGNLIPQGVGPMVEERRPLVQEHRPRGIRLLDDFGLQEPRPRGAYPYSAPQRLQERPTSTPLSSQRVIPRREGGLQYFDRGSSRSITAQAGTPRRHNLSLGSDMEDDDPFGSAENTMVRAEPSVSSVDYRDELAQILQQQNEEGVDDQQPSTSSGIRRDHPARTHKPPERFQSGMGFRWIRPTCSLKYWRKYYD
jgi:hypothetical protein